MSVRLRTTLPLALALALLAAAPSGAQDVSLVPSRVPAATAGTPTMPAAAPAPVGPTMQSATVAMRHQDEGTAAPAPRRGSAPGSALIIVGGAAILVGLVIGGSAGGAIAVGGAVAGLVGLYQYLQ